MSSKDDSDIPPPQLDELFRAIGKLAMAWSLVDFALTLWVEEIHDEWGGRDVTPELPITAFNRKLTYIREWWKSDESNQLSFAVIPEILDKLNHLSEQRHWAIHGVALDIPEFQETGKLIMRLRHKRNRKKTLIAHSDINGINNLSRDCIEWGRFLAHTVGIFRGIDDKSDDAFREMIVKLSRALPLED